MKIVYWSLLILINFSSVTVSFETSTSSTDSENLKPFSLTGVCSIFMNYVKNVAPALLTLSTNLNNKVTALKKLSNVQIIYDWPSLPALCVPAYTAIQTQNEIQLNAFKTLSSGSSSQSGQVLLLEKSEYQAIINAITLSAGGASTAVQGFNQYTSALSKLVDVADVDITNYNIDMPVALATDITNANKIIGAATRQIAFSFSSINGKNSTKIAAFQSYPGAVEFVNALFTYSKLAEKYTDQITSYLDSGPQQFYQTAKLNTQTEILRVPVKEVVNLIISPTIQLAKLYAKIGNGLNSFGNTIMTINE